MASPTLQTFCCMFNCTRHLTHEDTVTMTAYNSLCLISASFGFLGAVFQLWPRLPSNLPRGRRELRSFMRQNAMVSWLALADLLAAIGIIVRSAVWIAGIQLFSEVQADDEPDFAHIFCAVTNAWIQYFYICTYLWTLCYAIDTFLLASDQPSYSKLYHMTSWGLAALLCTAGLVPLYTPSLLSCEKDYAHLLPHYLSSYIPILLVLIANPIIYAKASAAVKTNLIRRGRYTDRERNIIKQVKSKFFLFIIVFYICWFPNIVNGILVILGKSIPISVHLAMFNFMAVVNPVQAFLNCLVYRGAGGCNCHLRRILEEEERRHHVQTYVSSTCVSGSDGETTPLLLDSHNKHRD